MPEESAYCEIRLPSGLRCKVSPEDYPELSKYTWRTRRGVSTSYVIRTIDSRKRTESMHRQIMKLRRGDKRCVDHMNHDGLDNRRENLRICTPSQNSANRRYRPKSGYKGVCAVGEKWQSQIQVAVDGRPRCFYIGIFDTAEEAARAYDGAARTIWGDFAHLNFPYCTVAP